MMAEDAEYLTVKIPGTWRGRVALWLLKRTIAFIRRLAGVVANSARVA